MNNFGIKKELKRADSFDIKKCQEICKKIIEEREICQKINRKLKRSNTDIHSKTQNQNQKDIYYPIGINKGKRINIIICDDTQLIFEQELKVIKRYFKEKLKEKNISPFIYYARDGIECLSMIYNFTLNNTPIKFILMDNSMEYLNGIDTANIIKKIIYFRHNHVYLVSGDVKKGDCQAEGFYGKPLTLESFSEIMEKYIK